MMRTSVAFILFTLLLLAGAIAHLSIGARVIAPRTVVDAFFHFDPRNFEHSVIVRLRLMRLCAALVTGAALGVAGVLLQSVIRNPLGEPHILGLNAGAALAVVLTSALGLSLPFGRPLIAAAGAAALFLLVLTFSSSGRTGLTPMKVTLCGVAMSAFASSITATVLILDEQTLLAMRTWLAGDVAGVIGETIASAAGGAGALAVAVAEHAGAGRQNGAGAWRVAAENAPARAAGHRPAVRRGGFSCRTDRVYRTRGAAADSPSGIGGPARDGAAFSPLRGAGSADGGYRRPYAVYAV